MTNQNQTDTIQLNKDFRMRLITAADPLPSAHVVLASIVEELDDARVQVLSTYRVQSRFTVDQFVKGEWVPLGEEYYTETIHEVLAPMVAIQHHLIASAGAGAFNQRLIPEYSHVPMTGHRAAQAAMLTV